MNDEREKIIKRMVDRFLGWKLPADFNPDAGISFKPEFNEHTEHPMRHEPTGTNLLDARQAEAMIRYLLEGADTDEEVYILTDGCMWEMNRQNGTEHPHATEVVNERTGAVRYIQSGSRVHFVDGIISDVRTQAGYNEQHKAGKGVE